MARVNVDQKALTDPRFAVLGSHLQPLSRASKADVENAYGLFVMVKVWNYCMERGLLVVPARDLDAIHPGLSDAMVDAQLGEFVPRSRATLVRIKGGEGRLDWLENARRVGRENGAKGAQFGSKGGRPRRAEKPPVGVSENPSGGFPNNPPLAPSPSPALRKNTPSECPPIPPTLDTEPFRSAWSDWQMHRREIKKPLTPTAVKQQLAKLAGMGPDRAVEALRHSMANGWQGIFEPDRSRAAARNPDQHMLDTIAEGLSDG